MEKNLEDIEILQAKIKELSNTEIESNNINNIPKGPNIARTSHELWQIFQYEKDKHELMLSAPEETQFLKTLLNNENYNDLVKERLNLLKFKNKPILEVAKTTHMPEPIENKIESAKLIGQTILNENKPSRQEITEQISNYQKQLMELEEKYLNSMS